MGKIYLNGESYGGDSEVKYYDYAYNNAQSKFLLDLYSSSDQQIEFDFKADSYINAMVITGDYDIGSVYYNNILYMNADRIAINNFAWTDRHKVVLNNLSNKVTIDGTEVGTYTNYDNTQHVLFGRTTSGGYSFFKGKVYEYKVVDKSTGNNLMWLKPAKVVVAGFVIAQGLYDVVNNVWITGNGLTVGNETS